MRDVSCPFLVFVDRPAGVEPTMAKHVIIIQLWRRQIVAIQSRRPSKTQGQIQAR